eukprot:3618-Heterococcus_DN1.PRE.1
MGLCSHLRSSHRCSAQLRLLCRPPLSSTASHLESLGHALLSAPHAHCAVAVLPSAAAAAAYAVVHVAAQRAGSCSSQSVPVASSVTAAGSVALKGGACEVRPESSCCVC